MRHTPSPTCQNGDRRKRMTLCPIAIVAGCQKCPAFSICPLKGVIGDQQDAGKKDASSVDDAKAKSTRDK